MTRRRNIVCALAVAALLLSGLAVKAWPDLPFGWTLEIFPGHIVDLEVAGGVVAGATNGGLLLYEPQSRQFRQIADTGCIDDGCLRSNHLTRVARDERGRYWVGTEASGVSLLRLQEGGIEYEHFFVGSLRPGGELLSDSVTAVATWRDETVYVGTPAGVAQIDLAGEVAEYNDESSRRRGQEGFPDAAVLDVAVDPTYVWVALETGVVRYRRLPPHEVEILADSLLGTRVNTVTIQAGEVWIGTDQGVQHWNEGDHYWMHLRNVAGAPEATPRFNAYSLAVHTPDPVHPKVTVGSDGDIREFQGFVWTRCNPAPLFLVEQRKFLTVASLGDSLWTSQVNDNGEGGYLEVRDRGDCNWSRVAPSTIPAGPIHAVRVDRNGRDLWVGTRISGIARRNLEGTWCEYNANDPDVRAHMTDPVGHVSAFLVDRSSAVWFSTLPLEAQGTVDILRGDVSCVHASDLWQHIAPGEGGFGGRYWRIEEDGLGNRYFLSDGHEVSPGGMDVLRADTRDTLNLRADLLGGNTVGAIAFDRLDGAWRYAYIGMNNLGEQGLVEWVNAGDLFMPSDANFTALPLKLPDGSQYTVGEYRDITYDGATGDLWVGTGQGLLQYSTSLRRIQQVIGEKDFGNAGLLSLDVRDLELDDRGNLWIATNRGLNRIRIRSDTLKVDAFTTRQVIDELNAAAGGAALYRPQSALAPLPDPRVASLAFDREGGLLQIATEMGVATVDVAAIDFRQVIPIERAVIYPNPVRVQSDGAAVYLGKTTLPATVYVYNLEGELVTKADVQTPQDVVWDLQIYVYEAEKTLTYSAASGVYLVRVVNVAGTKVAPLVVIR